MSYQNGERKTYGGEADEPECPPEQEYILMYMGVREIGMGKSFEGKEPQEQLILDFKIDAEQPQPGSLQEEWHHFDVRGYFTPILHYRPDLPGYTGQRYTEPNLYKLARALNGGVVLPMPTETNPETGKTYFAPYDAQDAADRLRPFIGRRIRSKVGPSKSGWPRLLESPSPLVPVGGTTRRTRGASSQPQPEPQPEPALAGVAAGAGGDEDDPFAIAESDL